MKKILANLALAGSLMVMAAVLAPLFHSIDQGVGLGLFMGQSDRGNLSTTEVVARADLSTGLVPKDVGLVAQFCGQAGQITDLICQTVAPFVTYE